jgi:hypothetical protein
MALLGEDAQDFVAAAARQHIGEKSAISDDDPEGGHEFLRGRNKITYAPPKLAIRPSHHTGACEFVSTVGRGFIARISLSREIPSGAFAMLRWWETISWGAEVVERL